MEVYEGFSGFGFVSLLLGVGILIFADGFAYALASALKVSYGRLIAGLTVTGLAFLLYTLGYNDFDFIALIGFGEIMIGLFDILAQKIGSPYWILLDPNLSPVSG